MTREELLIEDLYHALQHIKSDLDNEIFKRKIESITHTTNHCIAKIDSYFEEQERMHVPPT